jgi:hypothetical protein
MRINTEGNSIHTDCNPNPNLTMNCVQPLKEYTLSIKEHRTRLTRVLREVEQTLIKLCVPLINLYDFEPALHILYVLRKSGITMFLVPSLNTPSRKLYTRG